MRKYESHAADGVQQPRAATGFQLAAQVSDEYVDDVGVGGEVVAPHQFQQLCARQHRGLVLGQHGQQVELTLGQVDVDAVDPGAPARDVDLQRADRDGFRGRRRGGSAAAQQRAHPRHQLGQHERLDQVVVGAGLQAGHPVVDRAARGQDADRHVVVHRPQRGHHADAVQHRHVDVEHDRIRPGFGGAAQCLGAVDCGRYLEAGQPQSALQRRKHVGVVVDNQNPG